MYIRLTNVAADNSVVVERREYGYKEGTHKTISPDLYVFPNTNVVCLVTTQSVLHDILGVFPQA